MSQNQRTVERYLEGFRRDDGTALRLVMCDVFEMRDGKIRRLTSYIMPVP